jgi:threonyl-tRNA synthetase
MNKEQKQKELAKLRHSTAHLLAQAVLQLWPNTQLTIGPATEEGFFYDMLPERNFNEEDLPIIAERMKELAEKNIPFTHKQISKDEARKIYKNNPFKLELIEGIPGDTVGLAEQGDFYDLCRGDHVESTGQLKNFKLLGLAGSYWRADKNKQALQRIYGTAFFTKQELDDYEKMREDAAKYDHRKLGKQLNLFSFHEAGPGFPFFHPKGQTIINLMTTYMRKLLDEYEYAEVSTPILLDEQLWHTSGHWAYYKDNMYTTTIDERTFALKPMNCPGAILVYSERPHSYRELPMRLAEFGLDHRHELSGVLHGLMRVRAFTQDDAHVFCTLEQIEQEVLNMIKMAYTVYKKFGFNDIRVALATKPEKSMGTQAQWDIAIQALKNALDKNGIAYELAEGEGAFYGPKIEFHILDSMKRSWQCGTIQIDFNQPENFDLTYVTNQGTKERPVMIHRALYGSRERFFAILLEHYKGLLPFWLAPVQVRILTITDDQKEYAHNILQQLKKAGIRAEMDQSSDQISAKIKSAQLEKIPWMLVLGKKEVEQNTITLRYADGKQEFGLTLEALLSKARESNE